MDAFKIRDSLARLSAANVRIFGADGHEFLLSPPLSTIEVSIFEGRNQIQLPTDYRSFITTVGNGGAGPFYGIFPFRQWMPNFDFQGWNPSDGFVGDLSVPFPYAGPWNDLTGEPDDDLYESDPDEYERQLSVFEGSYWGSSHVNGAIPIATEGCAIWIWLVVTGEQKGKLWRDIRTERNGLAPIFLGDGSPATFGSWYQEWLDDALSATP